MVVTMSRRGSAGRLPDPRRRTSIHRVDTTQRSRRTLTGATTETASETMATISSSHKTHIRERISVAVVKRPQSLRSLTRKRASMKISGKDGSREDLTTVGAETKKRILRSENHHTSLDHVQVLPHNAPSHPLSTTNAEPPRHYSANKSSHQRSNSSPSSSTKQRSRFQSRAPLH